MTKHIYLIILIICFCTACAHSIIKNTGVELNSSASPELVAEILAMDKVLFDAANRQDLATMRTLFTKDLEWYQDNDAVGDYAKTMQDFEGIFNFDYKLTRTLIADTSEVHPIKDFGAVQIGKHQFCHNDAQGNPDCGIFGFVHLWKQTNGQWQIARVISYGH